MLQELPEHLFPTMATPAAAHLFKVRYEIETQYPSEEQ